MGPFLALHYFDPNRPIRSGVDFIGRPRCERPRARIRCILDTRTKASRPPNQKHSDTHVVEHLRVLVRVVGPRAWVPGLPGRVQVYGVTRESECPANAFAPRSVARATRASDSGSGLGRDQALMLIRHAPGRLSCNNARKS